MRFQQKKRAFYYKLDLFGAERERGELDKKRVNANA